MKGIKMKFKKIISGLMLPVMLVSLSSCTNAEAAGSNTMRDMTTMEIVRDMGLGINLGNTLEDNRLDDRQRHVCHRQHSL